MRIIVSFTSYPPRIDNVHKVVESLYNQTVRADEIVLYLSLKEFPDAWESMPCNLKKLVGKGGFRIEWVKGNLKSHKKYYYALQQYREDVVITVDDDVLYAETMISDLMESHNRFPSAVSARKARMIVKKDGELEIYSRWKKRLDKYADMPRIDLCAIGVGGICYPPLVSSNNWFNESELIRIAGKQDDLWLKYNEVLDGIPVVYTIPSQCDVTIDNSQVVSLGSENLYHGENDKCIRDLLILIKNKNGCIYNNFFQSLMSEKNYYQERFGDIINSAEINSVYLYGAGKIAARYMEVLDELQLSDKITAVVVTEREGNSTEMYGVKVISLQELDNHEKFGLIFGVSDANRAVIESHLLGYDYQCIPFDGREIQCYYRGW